MNRMIRTNTANTAWLNFSQLLNKCIFVLIYCTKKSVQQNCIHPNVSNIWRFSGKAD